jgi:NAD(P)-dependent dehydrogenase (short-subunit alcohol dehydrogenase family)
MSNAPLTLVTGASSGIGREIAIRLSASRSVLIHGRDQSRLEETLSLCSPGSHRLWNFDLEKATDIRPSLTTFCGDNELTVSEFVHCAGVPSVSAARMMSAEQMQKVFNINTISALEICATLLRKSNHGALRNIVFVTSIWGSFGSIGHTVYSATKGALDASMKSLAVELAPATRVNSLSLGAVDTPMASAALSNPEIRSHTEKNYPLGIGTTEDAAAVCEFILSDAAKWITGQVLVADGGRTAHMSNK